MKKQSLPILLILMMLITPIASALDHCAGMDMSGHFSASQSSAVMSSSHDAMPLGHDNMLTASPYTQLNGDCHSGGSCTIHLCGGDGITSSVPGINIVASFYYSPFEYISPYDTALSPDLRPPKQTL